jgi:hypothetical protein
LFDNFEVDDLVVGTHGAGRGITKKEEEEKGGYQKHR